MPNHHRPDASLPMWQVLLCGGLVVSLSMGVRHGFGLWLQPVTQETGWTRESFSLALAVQNIAWGAFGVVGGMLADRFGAFRVLMGGGLLYALGLAGMALARSEFWFALTAGILIGAAQAGTTYAVVYGVLGRQIPLARRSWAMGAVAAAGSFGQFLMVPLEERLIAWLGWAGALLMLAAVVLLIVPLAWGLRERAFAAGGAGLVREQSIAQALLEAWRTPSFVLLTAGYFVCGFQLMFIGIHMPSYLRDHNLPAPVAGHGLALIGLFNIFGTYAAGSLAQRLPKRHLLAGIYLSRALVIALFLLLPLSAASVYGFCALMGLLWLSTVPLTNALVAQFFGVQHLSMLGGVVFFSHQIGSFLGIWLGGWLYDQSGSYNLTWYLAIALGVAAAALNLPIREAAVPRLRAAAA